MSILRRVAAAVTHSGPGYDRPHIPRQGDDVEQWLTRERDQRGDMHAVDPEWFLIDDLIRRYQAHARLGVPLDQSPCRCTGADCAACDQRHPF